MLYVTPLFFFVASLLEVIFIRYLIFDTILLCMFIIPFMIRHIPSYSLPLWLQGLLPDTFWYVLLKVGLKVPLFLIDTVISIIFISMLSIIAVPRALP